MNKEILEERSKRLLDVNKIIKDLDPSIRLAAFTLLEDYVTADKSHPGREDLKKGDTPSVKDREAFLSKFNTDKPADNTLLLAAYLYGQYGLASLSVDEIKSLATEVGLIVPDRVDMTLRNAQREGKNLFLSTGRGVFKPTVHGALFFKSTYNVSEGTSSKTAGGAVLT